MKSSPMALDENMLSEGDVNLDDSRAEWVQQNASPAIFDLLKRDADVFLHQSLSTPCLNALQSCSGSTITDLAGNKLLDFHGNYIHNIGFGHPAVTQAITKQLETLSFSTRRYTNEPAVRLAEKLTSYTNFLKRILFAPGGAEAIGMALKTARLVTGRHKIVSLWDSFHGATLEASSIGGEAMFRKNMGPLLTGTEHAPPPNPSDCPYKCGIECNLSCANYIEYILEKEGDVAAVVAETIRSTPFIPPPEYWRTVRKACDRHGALLILDEIPHALGRTGTMFTFQHYGIEPDMVVIGKGLGGGVFPFAALLVKNEFNDAVKSHAIGHYTHEKNPVASAAALAMLEVIEQEGLLERVQKLELHVLKRMESLKEKHSIIYSVRALGLMMGLELRNPDTGKKATQEAVKIMYHCIQNGLNFKLSMGSTINLTPPMTVLEEELDRAFSIIDNALSEIC